MRKLNIDLYILQFAMQVCLIWDLVNIYFGFYRLAECSISRKFYKTHLEVFKSLHWIISIPWWWVLELTPSWHFWLQFSKISAPTFSQQVVEQTIEKQKELYDTVSSFRLVLLMKSFFLFLNRPWTIKMAAGWMKRLKGRIQ